MVGLFFTVLCFLGLVFAVHHWLGIKLSYSPLFTVSFIGILLYLFAVSGCLKTGAWGLIVAGGLFAIFFVIVFFKSKSKENIAVKKLAWVFGSLMIVSFLLTLNMAFTVIDDYVYWGIIGKYLSIYDHLPVTGNPLDSRILAYTPGTALIHYLFYLIPQKYSVDASYFAQNIILISALFVVVDKENIKKSIGYLCALVLLMIIFAGSVFTKLQVDYLLSIICFSTFWMYYNEKNIFSRLLVVSMPICFLFLIKEIGFVLGLLILGIILCDVLVDRHVEKNDKIKSAALILLIGGCVFVLKKLWISHVAGMEFVQFHNAINLESVKKTLYIFTDKQVQNGFIIFAKDIFIGSADRLNLPYVLWYSIIAFLGYKIFKENFQKNNVRFFLFSGMLLLSFLLYLFLLYCMQIIIFGVGTSSQETLGFSRYLNIVFSPIVFIVVLSFVHRVVFVRREISRRVCISIIVIVLLVLSASRAEVYLHREKQDVHIQKVSQQIASKINKDIYSIGIVTKKRDNLANLQFLFYLLPNKVDYSPRIFENGVALIEYVRQHDYIIFYNPAPNIFEWLESYMDKKIEMNPVTLLRVRSDNLENSLIKKHLLERVPL